MVYPNIKCVATINDTSIIEIRHKPYAVYYDWIPTSKWNDKYKNLISMEINDRIKRSQHIISTLPDCEDNIQSDDETYEYDEFEDDKTEYDLIIDNAIEEINNKTLGVINESNNKWNTVNRNNHDTFNNVLRNGSGLQYDYVTHTFY